MLIMDPDSVLGPKPDDCEPDAGHLFLRREASRNSQAHPANTRPSPRREPSSGEIRSRIKDHLGRIKPLGSDRNTRFVPATTLVLNMPDDGLSSARGILVGVALGLGIWALIAGLIGILYL